MATTGNTAITGTDQKAGCLSARRQSDDSTLGIDVRTRATVARQHHGRSTSPQPCSRYRRAASTAVPEDATRSWAIPGWSARTRSAAETSADMNGWTRWSALTAAQAGLGGLDGPWVTDEFDRHAGSVPA